jgi:LemA protein
MLLIILTIVIILTIISSIIYNLNDKLNYYKLRIDKAEKQIEEELDNRYEIVKEIQKTIEKTTKKEFKIYKDLDELKDKQTISTIEYDNLLNELVNLIYLIENDYPKINKKQEFKDTLTRLNESNTIIIAAKSFYNESNTEINNLLKKFPTNILGKIKGISILPNYYIEEDLKDEY